MTIDDVERAKYERMWAGGTRFDYRRVSPAEAVISDFILATRPEHGATIVDLGCGTGRAALDLLRRGFIPICVDVAANCLDPEVAAEVPLVQACLWDVDAALGVLTGHKPGYGLCCDVMEHVPTNKVGDTLAAIRRAVEYSVWFQPATFPHEVEDLKLHLTVRPSSWWLAQFEEHWPTVEQTGPDDQRPQFTCKA